MIKTRIIKIGNSRGVRIPKPLLDHVGLRSEVEISVQRDQLTIRSASHARDGWDKQFRAMAQHGDDRLRNDHTPTHWDSHEWQW